MENSRNRAKLIAGRFPEDVRRHGTEFDAAFPPIENATSLSTSMQTPATGGDGGPQTGSSFSSQLAGPAVLREFRKLAVQGNNFPAPCGRSEAVSH